MITLHEMFARLFSAAGQGRVSRTVEVYGWFVLAEGAVVLAFPDVVAELFQCAPLDEQGVNVFRIVGLLMGAIGTLYAVSGRMNSEGFAFATLLDRPLVPPIVAVLWYFGMFPGALALAFSAQEIISWFWTLATWRTEMRRQARVAS